MPTYSYACKDCGHAFDTVQSFSDPSLTTCPECGGNLRKVFNSVGVVFKGSGFYRTDSRGKDGSTGTSADKAKTADKGTTADTSTSSGSTPASGSTGTGTPSTSASTGTSTSSTSSTSTSAT